MKIKNLGKIPKRVVTMDELLKTEDISSMLAAVNDAKPEINALVVAWQEKGGQCNWILSDGVKYADIFLLLELIKDGILRSIDQNVKEGEE